MLFAARCCGGEASLAEDGDDGCCYGLIRGTRSIGSGPDCCCGGKDGVCTRFPGEGASLGLRDMLHTSFAHGSLRIARGLSERCLMNSRPFRWAMRESMHDSNRGCVFEVSKIQYRTSTSKVFQKRREQGYQPAPLNYSPMANSSISRNQTPLPLRIHARSAVKPIEMPGNFRPQS